MEIIRDESVEIKKKRVDSVIKETALIIGILVGNAVIYGITGYGIPCIFRLVTGLQCPGCGMTHAYLELFKGNLEGAINYNILSVSLLPVLGLFLLYKGVILLKTGEAKIKKWENILLIFCAIIIGVFFVYRNIPVFLSFQSENFFAIFR